jgi:ATP-dependent RNA helicase DeaD
LKINLGTKDGLSPKRLLSIINDVTDDRTINVGSIEVTNKFTFFDVFADQADQVLHAFANNGGPLEVGIVENRDRDDKRPFRADKKQGDRRESRRGSDRPYGRSNERPARRRDDSASAPAGEKPWRKKRY